MDRKTVFITGVTGLIGSYLLKIILQNGHKVICLSRNKDSKKAKDRVREILGFWDEEALYRYSKNLLVMQGDISEENFGLIKKDYALLANEVGDIYHCAAITELSWPLEEIQKVNREGTRHVLELGLKCSKKGKVKKVNYISTAYVCGNYNGVFKEDDLYVGQKFNNSYEQSKYEAELLVRSYIEKGSKVSIFRPSLVMGDSKEGKTTDFRVFYKPIHFFMQMIYDIFPATVNCCQNLINVDTVAKMIFLLSNRDEASVYHLISPQDTNMVFLMKIAADYFGFKCPKFISLEKFDFKDWTVVQNMLAKSYIPYFNSKTKFSIEKTQSILKESNFKYPKIDKKNLIRNFQYFSKRKR